VAPPGGGKEVGVRNSHAKKCDGGAQERNQQQRERKRERGGRKEGRTAQAIATTVEETGGVGNEERNNSKGMASLNQKEKNVGRFKESISLSYETAV